MAKVTEGYMPFLGYETYYRVVGERKENGKAPLICLHGGPGSTHNYYEVLDNLADDDDRQIIMYDQIYLPAGDDIRDEARGLFPAVLNYPVFILRLPVIQFRRYAAHIGVFHVKGGYIYNASFRFGARDHRGREQEVLPNGAHECAFPQTACRLRPLREGRVVPLVQLQHSARRDVARRKAAV